jgi:hypothetical protein
MVLENVVTTMLGNNIHDVLIKVKLSTVPGKTHRNQAEFLFLQYWKKR